MLSVALLNFKHDIYWRLLNRNCQLKSSSSDPKWSHCVVSHYIGLLHKWRHSLRGRCQGFCDNCTLGLNDKKRGEESQKLSKIAWRHLLTIPLNKNYIIRLKRTILQSRRMRRLRLKLKFITVSIQLNLKSYL